MSLSISIFSYNRGNYVQNCVDSINHCLSGSDFKVFDDSSTDKETLKYLKSLGDIVTHCYPDGQGRHGGLYSNMQRALDSSTSKYILFLQDDMQLVRVVDEYDFKCIDAFFSQYSEAAFVNPVFLKGHRRRSILKQIMLQSELEGYFHDIPETLKPRPVSMFYCDVVIAHVDRLRSVNWQFADSETANAEQARKHFSKMLQMAHPFVMHVPEVPVFRGKKTTIGSRLATKLVGADVKSFVFMSGDDVEAMRCRDLNDAPFAEDFLVTKNKKVGRPFRYNAVNSRAYTRVLHKIEQTIKG